MRVAVIGAGPAGLTAAYQLGSSGIEVDMYEVAPKVGGLAKTIRILNNDLEMGAHFLRVAYFEKLIQQIPELKAVKYQKIKRETGILFKGNIFEYPPSIQDLVKNFAVLDLAKFSKSFFAARLNGRKLPANADTFLGQQLGRKLYRDFFESYIQKIWGIPGNKVDTIFASGLIGNKDLSFNKIAWNILFTQKNPLQNFNSIIYPEKGFSTIWETLAEVILKQGSRILTNTRILNLDRKPEGKISIKAMLKEEFSETYESVVATLPPAQLVNLFNLESGVIRNCINELSYRNIIFIYLRVRLSQEFLHQCLYLYDANTPIARVTCFTNFSGNTSHEVFLSVEYWVGNGNRKWLLDDEVLLQEVESELSNLTVFRGIKVLEGVVMKIKNAYLIPTIGMPERLQEIQSYFRQFPELILTGRNQAKNFNYSIEDAMDDGRNAANQILSQS